MSLEMQGINQQEEKELHRVFDQLCNYLPKSKINAALQPLLERKSTIQAHQKSPDAIKVTDNDGNQMSEDEIEEEYQRLNIEVERLQNEIARFDQDGVHKKIHPGDLNEALKALGKKSTKKEIQEMIWEVDENLDGCVDWDECRLMYQRNMTDRTGLEPYQLFNMVQFMTYDQDGSGTVSVDETMNMLYARFGREQMEREMHKLFKDNERELSFARYLEKVTETLSERTGRFNKAVAKKSKREP